MLAVTGTPGTGKTTVAKAIAQALGYVYVDVNKLINERKLSEGYDKERDCEIVNTARLSQELLKLKGDVVIDSHLSHFLPKEALKLVIVTRCNLKVLRERLQERGYNKKKIEENLQAEIFENCLHEARDLGHKVLIVDTTNGFDIKKIVGELR
ncbi:MAG: AAA family ATPase [Candidatus Woesearchaeota archaeon]